MPTLLHIMSCRTCPHELALAWWKVNCTWPNPATLVRVGTTFNPVNVLHYSWMSNLVWMVCVTWIHFASKITPFLQIKCLTWFESPIINYYIQDMQSDIIIPAKFTVHDWYKFLGPTACLRNYSSAETNKNNCSNTQEWYSNCCSSPFNDLWLQC